MITFKFSGIPECPELDALIREAVAKVNAMTPEECGAMHEAQRKSWVIGEMMLEHPGMTREEAERIYNEIM